MTHAAPEDLAAEKVAEGAAPGHSDQIEDEPEGELHRFDGEADNPTAASAHRLDGAGGDALIQPDGEEHRGKGHEDEGDKMGTPFLAAVASGIERGGKGSAGHATDIAQAPLPNRRCRAAKIGLMAALVAGCAPNAAQARPDRAAILRQVIACGLRAENVRFFVDEEGVDNGDIAPSGESEPVYRASVACLMRWAAESGAAMGFDVAERRRP